jgi:hypothetical protein
LSKLIVFSLIAATVLALGAAAGACGGGGEELTLEEYFQKMQAISAEAVQETEALDEKFEALEEDDFGGLRDLFAANTAITADTFGDMDDIDPPGEVEDAHIEFVDAGEDVAELMEGFGDDLADVDSTSELEQAFERVVGLEAASARIDTACAALEKIAAENDISVDLDCDY